MWALIVAPTDVHPHFLCRYVAQSVIECFHMGICNFDEFSIRQVGKQHVTAEREVRAVKLQIEASSNDRVIFCLHRVPPVPRGMHRGSDRNHSAGTVR